MPLCESHKNRLLLRNCIDPERPEIKILEERGQLRSVSSQEIENLTGWKVDGLGLYIGYPGTEAFVIRPDNPPAGGPKYIHPKGEPNSLFVPPGLDLANAKHLWITEGELKALCGFLYGLPVVALGGVNGWRTKGPEAELLAQGEKLTDDEALLPELAQINWSGKKVTLLYDSDITPGNQAYGTFIGLAEQLYRLGAEEVRILSLPSIAQGQKTGLDDFILARKDQALSDLQAMNDRKEPYLPIKAGAVTYAERLIKSPNLEDKLKATVAYLGAKGKAMTLDWLKKQVLQSDIRNALLTEAKEKLSLLRTKPKSTGYQDTSSALGPEYDTPRALLKDHLDQYDLDANGRLGRVGWEEATVGDGKKELTRVVIHLCNFSAWPTRDVLKDDGLNTERFIEFQGILQGGTLFNPVKVPAKIFQDMKWLIEAWGVRAAIRPKLEQEVRYALQLMAQSGIPETKIYTHLGWRKLDNKWVYIHAGGAVGSVTVEVEITDRLRKYMLPEDKGDIKKALKASMSLLKLGPKRIMYPLYSLVWLTPLCEPLRKAGIEPSHVTYIWGSSDSFKSTLTALMLCHYGDFGPRGLPASFRDSPKSIEEMAFQAKDTLLVVDDLYPAKDPKERARLEGVLEYLTRNQGDRQGRGRLNSKINLMAGHPPRGLVVCSGEIMPLSGSSLARNFVLHIQNGDIDQEKLTVAQAQKAFLPHAMRGYLEYLAPQLDTLPAQLPGDFELLREQAKKESKIRTRHRRLDETVAFLYLGLQMFLRYAVDQEALTKDEAVELLKDAWETLNQVADELAQVAGKEEPTRRFFEAIQELQAQGRVYFATMEDAIPETAEQTPGMVKIGWGPENGVYYLLYGPVWEQVTKYLRNQEESLSLSKNSLMDAIEQTWIDLRRTGDL